MAVALSLGSARSYTTTFVSSFNLVVDVEIEAGVLKPFEHDFVFNEASVVDGVDSEAGVGEAAFLFLSASIADRPPPVWTLAKLRRRDGALRHFWPCTREEMELRWAGIATLDDVFAT